MHFAAQGLGDAARLVNPAPRGVAQTLRGEVHLADIHVGAGPLARLLR